MFLIRILAASVMAAAFTTACAQADGEPAGAAEAKAVIVNNEGEEVGSAHLVQGPRGVLMKISARDLPPGKHGMHFHAVGACAPLDSFTGAGGHIMPKGLPHGFLNPDGPHAGNLPNLIVSADGTAEVELLHKPPDVNPGRGRHPG